jgi:5-methylcytosine-specific restriction endonuclease McrA
MSEYLSVRQKKAQFKEMAKFFHNKCVRCEGASGLANVERDHIIPSYRGGADNITNYQPLCARCNASKGAETIDHRILFAKKYNLEIPKNWLP